MRCSGDREEKVISDWVWMVYDDHGPWNSLLGDEVPSHGWRRVVELKLGPAELIVTEWLFGRVRPSNMSGRTCREVHGVRIPFDDHGPPSAA